MKRPYLLLTIFIGLIVVRLGLAFWTNNLLKDTEGLNKEINNNKSVIDNYLLFQDSLVKGQRPKALDTIKSYESIRELIKKQKDEITVKRDDLIRLGGERSTLRTRLRILDSGQIINNAIIVCLGLVLMIGPFIKKS